MCSTLPSPRIVALASGVIDSGSVSNTSFFKDGRKVSVGDCALFKPEQESAPFVGIIRCLISDKESSLTLGLNWLYRPAEVKLPKGVALEAAPNEVFYSFHRDEIPAESLLHPCKVAFLPKGVELPAGASSFVCRRVYDITNKCLWWLTDQDCIDERQEEVDQLLHKTRLEMHASVEQHSTRSPKLVNGSAATSPLKQSPDSVQNSSSNFSSQTKGKKRERSDQSSEPIKRERSLRADDGDSSQLRSEGLVNLEIAKLSEKGGLVDTEAVTRLVRLMQPDKSEKKIDLRGRSLLAGIIAATDKLDCLNHFVHLRGLPVLDVWLQEIHKGKIGDFGSLKDSDKSVEDFLLVLLRALDKLPVNLNALQMCNIGKSVNHLRSHKNPEIQKKARTLVDTWKKRVEAEMNVDDAKLGSSQSIPWPGRSRHDGFHGGNKHSVGSSEAAIRSSATHHPSSKSTSVKLVQGESNIKSSYHINARSALSPTSANTSCKDGQLKISTNGVSELPQTVAREEKSSSSSQSHTTSQCSSERAKNAFPSAKEDARRSTAGSRNLNKTTGSSSKHRKSPNGPTSSIHREAASNRSSSMARSSPVEKVSHNATDSSVPEGNNHKLIVKIPNRARVPAQSNTGISVDDYSCRNSRVSSPTPPEKLNLSDSCVRGKHDTHQANEVDGSSAAVHQRPSSDSRRLLNVSKDATSPARNEMKSIKAHDSSFSSMNALVESCANLSEADASMSAGDDVGMNLLASVAASEISKSGFVTPAVSPHRNSATFENSSGNCGSIKKELHIDHVLKQEGQSSDVADADNSDIGAGNLKANGGDANEHSGAATEGLHRNNEGCMRNNCISDGPVVTASLPVSPSSTTGKSGGNLDVEVANTNGADVNDESHNKSPAASQALDSPEEADVPLSKEAEKSVRRDTEYTVKDDDVDKNNVSQGLQSSSTLEHSSLAVASQSGSLNTDDEPAVVSSGTSQSPAAINSNEKPEKTGGFSLCDSFEEPDKRRLDCENDAPSIRDKKEDPGVCSAVVAVDVSCNNEKLENEQALVQRFGSSGTEVSSSAVVMPEIISHSSSGGTGDSAAAKVNTASSPAGRGPDEDEKLGFDLNEGFILDEGSNVEPVNLGAAPGIVCSSSPVQVSVSSSSGGGPASITVAAAAKGPFLPPDDLLRNRRELGWKGSAATSAFRPAEPRKLMELPLGVHKAPLLDAPCKQARLPLDIDLNVADESSGLECSFKTKPMCDIVTKTSLRSYGGLDLDLNKADEAPDTGQQSCSNSQRVEDSMPLVKLAPSSKVLNGEASGRRDFDLNDGPAAEEPVEQTSRSLLLHGNIPLQPSFGPRINSSDSGNLFSWYPPGTSYSVSVTPSALPDRDAFPIIGMGGAPQRVMGGPTSSLSFHPDAYRGSVLSSSPAIPFQSAPFQYPVFPFGTSFPLPTSAMAGGPSGYMDPVTSGRISAIPSQLVGNGAAVSFQYPHAYVVPRPVPDVINNGAFESSQKWGKQGLDLNSGPGGSDLEGRDDSLPAVSRQVSTISPLPLSEEQARMYSMGGGVLKRKEPEGGWNMDKFDYKQSSWR